jgi:catechol 2,3-dioxygenase-like lactoylglutathione lyase family enzyme
MIDHISLRSTDFEASKQFYEKALAPLGYEIKMTFPDGAGFGAGGTIDFWLTPGQIGTPAHIAFSCPDRATVDAFHSAAIAAGAKDNGAPGLRADYHPNYYGAFVLDRDGHNIEAVCHLAPGQKPAAKRAAAKSKPRAAARKLAPKAKAKAKPKAKKKASPSKRR